MRWTSPPPAISSSSGAPAVGVPNTASIATPPVAPDPATVAATTPAPAAIQGGAVAASGVGSSSMAPAQRRYHTRVGPTPPDPSHPKPTRRAPPPKRARTLGSGESSTSRPLAPPSPPYHGIVGASDLSFASIIRRIYIHYSPILGNSECSARDLHGEVYYDLPAFSEDPELRDSMLLVQQYHLGPFMMPRRFFYPRVVIEFYHTMTYRREASLTALHFSIDDRPGILRAFDITAALHFPMVLSKVAVYRQWPHPSTREMVRLLSWDTTAWTILFRRHLPQCMLLIDHILLSNMFPLQHIVKRRGAILEALYCIYEGFWFSPTKLIMTSLFQFEYKVHRWSLP